MIPSFAIVLGLSACGAMEEGDGDVELTDQEAIIGPFTKSFDCSFPDECVTEQWDDGTSIPGLYIHLWPLPDQNPQAYLDVDTAAADTYRVFKYSSNFVVTCSDGLQNTVIRGDKTLHPPTRGILYLACNSPSSMTYIQGSVLYSETTP